MLTAIRIISGFAALCAFLIYTALPLITPPNYLITNPAAKAFGWGVNNAEIADQRFEAPDGSKTAIKATATGGDGHLLLFGLDTPQGPVTYSVYLKGDSRLTLKVLMNPDANEIVSTTARVTTQWQRFSVTGQHRSGQNIMVLVGGGETFIKGEAVYVWRPQLNAGSVAADYASTEQHHVSRFERFINKLGLRANWHVLPWIGVFFLALLIVVSQQTRPVKAVRAPLLWRLQQLKAACRTNRYHFRTALTYCAIVGATLIALEVLTFSANVLRALPATGDSMRATVASVWGRAIFWPASTGAAQIGKLETGTIFSPLTQVRRIPGDDVYPPYRINRLGLVDNEGASPALDAMPEKPAGMVRLILFGGSTAMGIGAPDGTGTITAQLEKLLNQHARPGVLFQVLNFGQGGSQTYSDLSFMVSKGIYLDPDVCISLNGFNDAFFASESSRFFSAYNYIINWSDFSYYYHNAINGLAPPKPVVVPLLPFTSMLYNNIMAEWYASTNFTRQFYEQMPMRLVTNEVDKSNPLRDRLLLENLRYTAGYFINREKVLLSYLQPHPLQFRELMMVLTDGLPSEETLVREYIRRLSRHAPDEYRRRMIALFDAYGERYKQLQKEYARYPNIRFFDIRDSLSDLPEPAYIDFAHYSVAGQRQLAERMFDDLRKFEAIRSKLKN